MSRKTFVTAGLIISFLLAATPALAAAPTVTSAKIVTSGTIVVTFSEAVYTQVSDYTNLYGSLVGQSVQLLTGSGTNTIILTTNGGAVAPNATGSLNLATTTRSVNDNASFVGGTVNITDGQPPVISSISISSTNLNNQLAKTGSLITLTFNTNEPTTGQTVSIAGHQVGVTGASSGPYTATYTTVGGDPENSIPANISFYDNTGNQASFSFNISGGSATAPVISSITSSAASYGVLKTGDTIVFTLTPSSPQPNATVSGLYNGVALSWSTSNAGATYTATYTVASGHNDQTSPLQITGVTMTNAGLISTAASSSDVAKTISASAPMLNEITAVPSQTDNSTPNYTFSSSKAGVITFGGDCSSQNSSASAGLNTITFNGLANGLHNNCTIKVTDAIGNASNQLVVSPFTVGAITATVITVPDALLTPEVTETFSFTRNLKIGSQGEDVSELQKQLATIGIYSGSITGYFGSLTEKAVKKFQLKNKLQQIGNVGPATRKLLNKLLKR